MRIEAEWLEPLIFAGEAGRRYTQNSPVLPDVWIRFGVEYCKLGAEAQVDVLLEPFRGVSAGRLATVIRERLAADDQARNPEVPPTHDLAYTPSMVVGRFTLRELLRVVLPLSKWWSEDVWRILEAADPTKDPAAQMEQALARLSDSGQATEREGEQLRWLVRLVGTILQARELDREAPEDGGALLLKLSEEFDTNVAKLSDLFKVPLPEAPRRSPLLFLVSRNREAKPAIARSTLAVKADAARLLFHSCCDGLMWAVIDSGIDATHPAFRRHDEQGMAYLTPWEADGDRFRNQTRIHSTYDFTRVRQILSLTQAQAKWSLDRAEQRLAAKPDSINDPAVRAELEFWRWLVGLDPRLLANLERVRQAVAEGLGVDWELLAPILRIPHMPQSAGSGYYRPPVAEHGTHVAGILAADWQRRHWPAGRPELPPEEDLVGVCPDLPLVDLRVFRDDGSGDEFAVIVALQFLRHLNSHSDGQTIHGVNLSLSIRHDVTSFACGRTPVCDECERVVSSGVVVVAAAGNDGFCSFGASSYSASPNGRIDGFRSISITDPGNAESVITVGSTHRHQPHTYGVSYFSSRGPTGDGRVKPDLVAPGEKITAPVPGSGAQSKDGTSMAAPHVSGAAALLMGRHRELAGQPARVKAILCATATDLGRERYFQGAGMLDILRALQSV